MHSVAVECCRTNQLACCCVRKVRSHSGSVTTFAKWKVVLQPMGLLQHPELPTGFITAYLEQTLWSHR